MDLISICKAIWRHKLAMLPVVLVTMAGAYYVLAIKPPVYQSTAEVLLVNPKIVNSSNPNVNDNPYADNPYANLGNLQEVADVVIDKVTSPAVSQGLINAGANPEYQVALSADVGSPPIIIVTGVGSTQTSAIYCAGLVANAVQSELYTLQANSGVTSSNMINSIEYVKPETAKITVSPKLRELIAVLAVGALLLLVVVSVADVLERRRRDRSDVAADELAQLDRQLDRRRGMRAAPAPARYGMARLFDDGEPDATPRRRFADWEPVPAQREPVPADDEPPPGDELAADDELAAAGDELAAAANELAAGEDDPMAADEPAAADDEPTAAADTTEFAAIDADDKPAGRAGNGKVGAGVGWPVSSRGRGR
jgi:capsular polysaccharide biosynthesis protein